MARRPGVSQPHLQDIFWSVSPGIGGQGARAAKAPTGPTSGPSSLSLLLTGPGKAVSPDPKDQAWLGGYTPPVKQSPKCGLRGAGERA